MVHPKYRKSKSDTIGAIWIRYLKRKVRELESILRSIKETRATQDRDISQLQAALAESQTRVAQYRGVDMPAAERELRLLSSERYDFSNQLREREAQVQGLQQALAAMTTERDEAQHHRWAAEQTLE